MAIGFLSRNYITRKTQPDRLLHKLYHLLVGYLETTTNKQQPQKQEVISWAQKGTQHVHCLPLVPGTQKFAISDSDYVSVLQYEKKSKVLTCHLTIYVLIRTFDLIDNIWVILYRRVSLINLVRVVRGPSLNWSYWRSTGNWEFYSRDWDLQYIWSIQMHSKVVFKRTLLKWGITNKPLKGCIMVYLCHSVCLCLSVVNMSDNNSKML